MTPPPRRYRVLSRLLVPLLLGHLLARARRDGGWRYLRERLGWIRRVQGPAPVWLHCASVGEVVTAQPLLQALAAGGTGPLVVSTNTPTGYATAARRVGRDARVVYLPLDRPRPLRRFLDRLRPHVAVILETELWPWLYAELGHRGIPIALVNARLTARTLEAHRWWQPVATDCVGRVTRILARSEEDAARFGTLGAGPDRVQALGNLKLAAAAGEAPEPIALGRPFVLAASTHDDEELRLADAWRQDGDPGHLLVIAPRHPERGAAIARELAAGGHRVARRSRDEPVATDTTVYLADTLGELTGLMAAAELVIMGGSLIPHGGQNVLEAARARRAIVTGPHMDNFEAEAEALIAAGALRQVADAREAVAATRELLAAPAVRQAMGRAGHAVLEAGADLAERYVAELDPLLARPR